MLFCGLTKGLTPKIRLLCFVIFNKRVFLASFFIFLFYLSCVWPLPVDSIFLSGLPAIFQVGLLRGEGCVGRGPDPGSASLVGLA